MNSEESHAPINRKQKILVAIIIAAVMTVVILSVIIAGIAAGQRAPGDSTDTTPLQTTNPSSEGFLPSDTEDDPEDPQPTVNENTGTNVDITDSIPKDPNETSDTTFGIDVSKYQGVIDWENVEATGIDFAMIRVGYRTKVDGEIVADAAAKYNLQQAQKYGIQIGVYFFSTAVTDAEAVEEANWVADYIAGCSITYPVAYNCEGFSDPENRQYSLSKQQRTDIALAFLDTVESKGYTPMFYASKGELQGDSQWETSRIEKQYKIWVAQYPDSPYPQTSASSYSGVHAMWQYTANGTVPGISARVDLNIAYFGYKETENPVNPSEPDSEEIDWDALYRFREVRETVTAKKETNLRDIPSQDEDSTVLYTLKNGETATRIAVSDYGWSKLEFNGQIYYAVSSYLTTDLSEPEYEIQTQFTPVNELVTAKEAVNLRTLPSVTHEKSEVVIQLPYGVVFTRTGINTDLGWSRVEYNGQTLYCVSQYIMLAEEMEGSDSTEAESLPTES